MIPPLGDEFKFRRLRPDNRATEASPTGDIMNLYVEQAADVGTLHWKPTAAKLFTLPNNTVVNLLDLQFPDPQPWGSVTATGNIYLSATVESTFFISINVRRVRANPITYLEELYVSETIALMIRSQNYAPGNNGLSIPISFKTGYDDNEIFRISVEFRQASGASISATLDTSSTISLILNDDYVREQRAGGLVASYQNLTEIQMSVAGKSTFELMPGYLLSRNLPIGYNVEIPGVAEIARDSYIRQLGNPLKCVYSALDFRLTTMKYIQQQSSTDIAMHAGTISQALFHSLNAALPFIINAGGAAIGAFSGDPLLGTAFTTLGKGLYSGLTNQGRNQVMSNATIRNGTSDIMRNSTMDADAIKAMQQQLAALTNQMSALLLENSELKRKSGGVSGYQQPKSAPLQEYGSFSGTTWASRIKEAQVRFNMGRSRFIPDGKKRTTFLTTENNIMVLPTVVTTRIDVLSTTRLQSWNTGNWSLGKNNYEDTGAIYTKFLGVTNDDVFDGAVVVSTRPLTDILGGNTSYTNVANCRVDSRIADDTFLLTLIRNFANSNLGKLIGGDTVYITLTYGGTIQGEMSGQSWHLAMYAMFALLGPANYYTGSGTAHLTPRDLEAKSIWAFEKGVRLIVALLNDGEADYDEFLALEGVITLGKASMGGAAHHNTVWFDSSSMANWFGIVPYAILTIASGAGTLTDVREESVAKQKASITRGDGTSEYAGPHGLWPSVEAMNLDMKQRSYGPYTAYIKGTGENGQAWAKALTNYWNAQNGNKVKNLFAQAEPWLSKQNRGGRSSARQPTVGTILNTNKRKTKRTATSPSTPVTLDFGGEDEDFD